MDTGTDTHNPPPERESAVDMTAERDLRAPEHADSPERPDADELVRGDVLLAAAVDELRERAERLHEATEDLGAQNERLLAAQEALEDERARYRELFDLAPDAFVLTDANGKIVEANGRASDFLGVRADLLVRETLAAFVEPAARDALRVALFELTKAGHRRTADLRVTPRDGATLDVEATVAAVPQRSDGGAFTGMSLGAKYCWTCGLFPPRCVHSVWWQLTQLYFCARCRP